MPFSELWGQMSHRQPSFSKLGEAGQKLEQLKQKLEQLNARQK